VKERQCERDTERKTEERDSERETLRERERERERERARERQRERDSDKDTERQYERDSVCVALAWTKSSTVVRTKKAERPKLRMVEFEGAIVLKVSAPSCLWVV